MKLLFLGDLFFDYDYIPEDYNRLCRYFEDKGYKVVVNLEGSLGPLGDPIRKRGANLHHNVLVIDALRKMPVCAVCLANNHTMDYGSKAIQYEIETLDKAGINHVGAGTDIKRALKEIVISEPSESHKVVLINFGWNVEETVYAKESSAGCAPLIQKNIIIKIKELREKYPNDFIVCIFHWGFEFHYYPNPKDIAFSHSCINAGCDLIIGHHPHVVQPKETWKTKNIYYSLGNFYFSSRRKMFSNKLKTPNEDLSPDVGLGVVFDTKTYRFNELYFQYNRKNDITELKKTSSGVIDITDCDFRKSDYYLLAKKYSNSFTPVLKDSGFRSGLSLFILSIFYFCAHYFSFIKKSNLGRKVIDRIKHSS